jgi:hypothetical protein
VQFSPEVLIVLGPLFAAAFAGLLQRYIGDKVAMGITTASVGVSLLLSWPIFVGFVWGDETARVIEKKIGVPVTLAPELGRHPASLRALKEFRTSWYAVTPTAKIKAA